MPYQNCKKKKLCVSVKQTGALLLSCIYSCMCRSLTSKKLSENNKTVFICAVTCEIKAEVIGFHFRLLEITPLLSCLLYSQHGKQQWFSFSTFAPTRFCLLIRLIAFSPGDTRTHNWYGQHQWTVSRSCQSYITVHDKDVCLKWAPSLAVIPETHY